MNKLLIVLLLASGTPGHPFFTPRLHPGERLGNVFSRTISYAGDSFPEVCYRVSGTCIYTVTDTSSKAPAFSCVYRYDGRPQGTSTVRISDNGKNDAYNGAKASVNTDGSGLLYNALVWGDAPAAVKPGDTWTVHIPQAWELGAAGTQTVTVIEVDAPNHTIRLKREGSSDGYYDNDLRQIGVVKDGRTLKMNVTPGTTHWVGYTTFKEGLVVSDELVSTRSVTLSTDSVKYAAQQREYILLNAMPG